MTRGGEQTLVLGTGFVNRRDQIENLVVETRGHIPIRVRDIADVVIGHEIRRGAAKRIGVPSELIVIEGAPHSFHLQPKQRDLRTDVLTFFDKHLKPHQ
mgnify:CR=1 FL=1